MKKTGHLVLADGSVYRGELIGEKEVSGELVFSTATTGYAEILTDPSYYGQIVVLANPEVGNYGVNIDDFQSDGIKALALVVRNISPMASSHRSNLSLKDWLMRERIPLLYGVDTRQLIIHLRESGSLMATCGDGDPKDLLLKAKLSSPMQGQRLSSFVGVKKAEQWSSVDHEKEHHVVVLDFGVKRSILKCLSKICAKVTLVPQDITPEEIWSLKPDGLFLSNGPGDPETEVMAVRLVKALLGRLPIFGVCLGHQILAQALGEKTYKLKFGHRGSNHAVIFSENRVIITAQNHGFAVRTKEGEKNISDETNEGLDRPELFAFSVQFHPEGSPGPLDGLFYFDKFKNYIVEWQKEKLSAAPQAWSRA